MKPDTITIRIVLEAELDADSADLTVVIEGSTVFSGDEAFKKAKELRALIDSLKETGVDEARIKLRSVEVNSQSFALIKTSSAKYTITVKTVDLERLPAVLGAIAAHKGAHMSHLAWNYSALKATRDRLRRDALAQAVDQARRDAGVLGVQVLGVHHLSEESPGRGYNLEYMTGDTAFLAAARGRKAPQEIGFRLGNATTAHVDLTAQFRVGAMAEAR